MVRSESDQIHVLVVDDDPYAIEFLLGDLRADSDIALSVVNNVDDAILHLKQHQVNVAVIDKMMPAGGLDFMITRGGFHTGIALAQIIRREYSSTKIIMYSISPDHDSLVQKGTVDRYISKVNLFSEEMIDVIRFLHHNIVRPQRAFIVHGHDTDVLEELKEFIQSLLGWPAPIILQEMPSKTSTIIEKFEEYAAQIDMIFVLMTPDDIAEEKTKHTSRARQNVILELGYFMGRLGRHSNRTFILKKGAIELPSDISGIIYIDISDGIFNASEKILHELQYLMHS